MHDQTPNDKDVANEPLVDEPNEVALRRSQRERRSAISNDYLVYLQESEFDIFTSHRKFRIC